MTSIADTPLARFETEGRLINPVIKDASKVAGRFLYRGELAVKLATRTERESRPPELKAEQVIAASQAGEKSLPFAAFYLLSFESLKPTAELLGDALGPDGKYFAFCSNIDLAQKYRVALNGVTFNILPLDESTVYNELLELLRIDRDSLKKLDALGKIDAIVNAVPKFKASYPEITYEKGLEVMQEVKNPGENRPV
ncbi:MAG: hypothetical protein ABW321_26340 [Polyangiales bacterium]